MASNASNTSMMTPATAPARPDTIEDLRAELFATMRGLRAGTVKLEDAKAIAGLGQVIVNSAKVEADVMKKTDHAGSGFITEAFPGGGAGRPRLVNKGMGNG